MNKQNDIIIIIAACPDENEALNIAHKLVEAKFAACVQLNPIKSVYRWQEKTHDESEVRLLIKTTSNHFHNVETLFKKNTSYDCPEIMSYKISQGTSDYIDWIREETDI